MYDYVYCMLASDAMICEIAPFYIYAFLLRCGVQHKK